MRVLSLFDGIGCGFVALKRAGLSVSAYWASEIDKNAIRVAQKHNPIYQNMGDIENWRTWDIPWGDIDLILGGSPCQGFSVAGKGRALQDKRSRLFLHFADILRHVRKKKSVLFLLENVPMQKAWRDHISREMGVEPLEVNSALVSAQNRRRLYWTNFPFALPEDKGIFLPDILCETEDAFAPEKTFALFDAEAAKGKILFAGKDTLANRIYNVLGERITVLSDKAHPLEKDVTLACLTPGFLRKEIHGMRFKKDKSFTLTTVENGVFTKGILRKFTPVECERLQTLPDGYTDVGLRDSVRAKLLGNAWTADVICHILKTYNGGT